jgi:uncharacterized protein YndB with AHSA1/START domain
MPSDADTQARTLVLSRVFDAPRGLLFKAWTTPEQVAAWWGPMGFVTTHCDMDIRPGGSFRFCMRSPEGEDRWKVGTYREIVAPERIVFTFAWADANFTPGHQTLVTVTLDDLGAKTRLTLRQEVFDTVDWCESHRIGWTSCLERFDRWLGTREICRGRS